MTVSTKFFNAQTIHTLGLMNERAVSLQGQISTGKKDLSPSDSPVDVSRLSAAEEIEANIARYQSNANLAKERLDLADSAMRSAQSMITRALELAIKGANDTYSDVDRNAIRLEIDQLRDNLINVANAKDALGQSLFGGFQTTDEVFKADINGKVNYFGDVGQHKVKVSDTAELATGLNGANTFMRVDTDNGPISLFKIFDGLSEGLKTPANVMTTTTFVEPEGVKVDIRAGRTPISQSFNLTGSAGTVKINADLINGAPDALIDQINELTSATGVSASEAAADGSFILTDALGADITISEYQVDGQSTAEEPRKAELTLTAVDSDGTPTDAPARTLADRDQRITSSITLLRNATNHIASEMARVGAYSNAAEIQSKSLSEQDLFIKQTKSNIADADLSKLITELQSLLTNRDATQQAFSRISGQSLFDYLR